MPILHRLATFRDDVIFFVWLYQKWAYKVDYSRVNEFGQGGEDEAEGEQKKKSEQEEETKGEKAVQGQSVTMKPTAAVATASGSEKKASAKKRK